MPQEQVFWYIREMESQNKIESLREDLKKLREKLAEVTLQKGLAAQDDKDLRENANYEYWLNQEYITMGRIRTTMELISKLAQDQTSK